MSIILSERDYIDLKNLVEETLDNVQSMCGFDESISNLEQIQEILERVNNFYQNP
ncbi:hypothetical protein Syn7502_03157 [Synechococcus sp. PCC 7502]|uniref:hypothetical protein n=1 Tax=Synechococcus sp. PCC 7502 TaxID=1173263 RepID=UPI00029FA247|nr:hypothetical protein [Synechococcus sp. PCC 7502]AFY75046.1 hypothetical protein Syn7502_03157 [Synechococcus sp. PCC 7502]